MNLNRGGNNVRHQASFRDSYLGVSTFDGHCSRGYLVRFHSPLPVALGSGREMPLLQRDADCWYVQGYSSTLNDAVANVMERYKRPFIAPGASSLVIWQRGRRYVFSIPNAIAQGRQKGALQLATQIGVKRIAVIGEGSVFPRQVTEGALSWAKKLGLNVVLVESYPLRP